MPLLQLLADRSTLRSELKSIMKPIVEQFYKLSADASIPNQLQAQRAVKQTVEDELLNGQYLRGPKDGNVSDCTLSYVYLNCTRSPRVERKTYSIRRLRPAARCFISLQASSRQSYRTSSKMASPKRL